MNTEEGEQSKSLVGSFTATIIKLKKKVQIRRVEFVTERVGVNLSNLLHYTGHLKDLASTWAEKTGLEVGADLLALRTQRIFCNFNSSDPGADKESREDGLAGSAPIIWGSNSGGKTSVRPVKLAPQQNVPPYTTWIYLDRNQRMTEDQSVQGRRRIYYDPDGNETLIASDSEEEEVDEEKPKHEFSTGEDYIIWMAVQERGVSDVLFEQISEFIEVKCEEVQARYEALLKDAEKRENNEGRALSIKVISPSGRRKGTRDVVRGTPKDIQGVSELDSTQKHSTIGQDEEESFEAKDLSAAMDSFDNLFCRRCLVFDCRLHGCSQALVHPSERQSPFGNPEAMYSKPCGPGCHFLVNIQTEDSNLKRGAKRQKIVQTEVSVLKETLSIAGYPLTEMTSRVDEKDLTDKDTLKKVRKHDAIKVASLLVKNRKLLTRSATKAALEDVTGSFSPHDEFSDSPISPLEQGGICNSGPQLCMNVDVISKTSGDTRASSKSSDTTSKVSTKKRRFNLGDGERDEQEMETSSEKPYDGNDSWKDKWTTLEKGLYEKGLQIFGKSSCMIARNMLKGCKTCAEVAEYIVKQEAAALRGSESGQQFCSDNSTYVLNWDVARARARFYGRRKGSRKLKFTLKSAGQSAIRKRLANGKDMPCRQYTPCGCLFSCGKQCPCQINGTCCEKYCGCAKGCKNRFRGCHCAKSQCCSRQCPCFAAGRECDPDVCRNCWIGCGDGNAGPLQQRDDNYECHNMKLLLKQQQRVLLSRSDVAGWGAFLKNTVSKHEYLGEYTGELISHREADKRGKIYDRENSSFLFNLNDQFVLDACRKGDKLKFANHSPNPNCYAKVIMVAGDHRVGIFAKERIMAGEELFYDYRYEADRAPVWARKGDDATNAKRDDVGPSTGRAQKAA